MFSGGSYDDVARWFKNFLNSHAKREDPRIEAVLDTGAERDGRSYGGRLRLGDQLTPMIELPFDEVAASRGSLAWCAALAARVRALAREQLLGATAAIPR